MSKLEVKPIRSFELDGSIITRRTKGFTVDKWRADQLVALGLVTIVEKGDNKEADEERSVDTAADKKNVKAAAKKVDKSGAKG